MKKLYDVGITGDVAGVDLALAAQLFGAGQRVSVLRYQRDERPTATWEHHQMNGFKMESIEYAASGREVWSWARKCHCVVSASGTLAFGLGRLWLMRQFLGLPPVISKCTGADICELSLQGGDSADRYRQSLEDSAVIWGIPYGECIENLVYLGHNKRRFVPGRYAGSGDLVGPLLTYTPFPVLLPGLSVPPVWRWSLGPTSHPMTIFHPTNLEWDKDPSAGGRNSLKGSDRFLKAVLSAMDLGMDAIVHILDRGPDRDRSRDLVCKSAHAGRFQWHPEMTRLELLNAYVGSDLVIDSFGVGALGFISLEAMSVAAPVMCYVDREAEAVTYGSPAPVFSVSTQDDIRSKLLRLEKSRTMLQDKSAQGREWIEAFHGPTVMTSVLRMIERVTHPV